MRAAKNMSSVLEALKLAAPVAAAVRFEHLAHCFETSWAGADVLASYGIEAKLVSVYFTVFHEALQLGLVVGANDDEAMEATQGPKDRARPVVFDNRPDGEDRFHCVIATTQQGRQAWLDLTLGQVRIHGPDVPATFSHIGADFTASPLVTLETRKGWKVTYYKTRTDRIARLREKYADMVVDGYAADIRELTDLALHLGNDRARFYAYLARSMSPRDLDRLQRATSVVEPVAPVPLFSR